MTATPRRRPRLTPCAITFISHEQYEDLWIDIRNDYAGRLLDDLGLMLEDVPGFTVDGDELIGPETYARGVRYDLEKPFMVI